MIFLNSKKASNQWIKLNQIILNFKWVTLALLLTNLSLVGLSVYAFNKKAIVIGLSESENLYFVGSRKNQPITEADVLHVSKRFIESRYAWKSYAVDSIVRDVTPVVTYGFLKKLIIQLEQSKDFIDKNKVSQDVIIQSIKTEDGSVTAYLDQVVAVGEKVKAVRPIKVSLEIIKESANKFNPRGLYVNSIIEFEE